MRSGSLIVKFRAGAPDSVRAQAHRAAGARHAEGLLLTDTVRVTVDQGRIDDVLARYSARPDVEYAHPDYLVTADRSTSDPLLGDQYGLHKIAAPAAWDGAISASSVRIAIVDCGIYGSTSARVGPDGHRGHADLRDKIVDEVNFSTSPTGADDLCNHGTSVAGIATATTGNGIGIAGVGFNASILNAKVLNDDGVGATSAVINGIIWSADHSAQVINLSLGSNRACPAAMQNAVDYAWARGAVIVAAAGNENRATASSPANCANVIGVAATDRNDNRATFSNFGENVDIGAPGVGIITTRADGRYALFSGTSHAAPHVAGAAALVWGTPFGSSNASVVDRLLSSADRIAGTGSIYTHGRLNAATAVASLPAPGPCPSPRPPVRATLSAATGTRDRGLGTITAGAGIIREVRVGPGTNARIDIGGHEYAADTFTFTPTSAMQQVTFLLRAERGDASVTVPLVVVDDCGEWRTFVGAGAHALTP